MTAPTVCALSSRSPVTMTMRRIPSRRSWRIVRAASGRIGSSSSSAPTGAPSTSTKIVSAPSSAARRRTLRDPRRRPAAPSVQLALPTATRWPSTIPRTPCPGTSSTSSGNDSVRLRARAARTTAAARTCGDTWSRLAAQRRTSSAVSVGRGDDVGDAGRPAVIVPVLSNSRISPAASCSSAAPPFTTTPRRAARDRPDTIATGAARMSGHGVATTSTATARTRSPEIAHAAPASASATTKNSAA